MNIFLDFIQAIDLAIIYPIYNIGGNAILDAAAILLSYIGSFRLGIITVGILLMLKKETRQIAYILFAAALLSGILVYIIKEITDRPRPFIELGLAEANLLIHTNPYRSFPSGHTAAAFTTASVIAYYFKKWIIPAAIAACIAGFARIYLLVHYPSDVIAGAAIGIGVALMIIWIFEKYISKTNRNEEKTANADVCKPQK